MHTMGKSKELNAALRKCILDIQRSGISIVAIYKQLHIPNIISSNNNAKLEIFGRCIHFSKVRKKTQTITLS